MERGRVRASVRRCSAQRGVPRVVECATRKMPRAGAGKWECSAARTVKWDAQRHVVVVTVLDHEAVPVPIGILREYPDDCVRVREPACVFVCVRMRVRACVRARVCVRGSASA